LAAGIVSCGMSLPAAKEKEAPCEDESKDQR
jgi:hypothetical protein